MIDEEFEGYGKEKRMLYRTNVTNIGDPFIILDDKEYIMYTTSFGMQGFRYYCSENLQDWKEGGIALDLSDSWASTDFWAPEVIQRPKDNKYVMHFSARHEKTKSLRIGVAVADKPQGPFLQIKNEPMFDFGYAAIDGHVFIDDDGQAYFYYSRDCSENIVEGKNVSQIYVVKLNDDLTEVVGEPKLLLSPTHPFECEPNRPAFWNEGPTVIKKDGKYYLFYSANFYASRKYCVCMAISEKPDANFVKSQIDNPILHADLVEKDFSGPGHNCIFTDKEGKMKTAFHIHTNENMPSENRRACIADIVYENDNYKIVL